MPSDYKRIREENLREYGHGARHLSMLGSFYTDRTHFIFELLQNAEDAGATQVGFDLHPQGLVVRHDGRPFTEADVRGICGVGEGTKTKDLTQIGKFGIGFKSVYAYTKMPGIHSGDEHFCIESYVRPCALEARQLGAGLTTLFTFPFNRDDVPADQAFREIEQRLANLNPQTLLFLRSVRAISWHVAGRGSGSYARREQRLGRGRRIELRSRTGSEESEQSWLLFGRPVHLAGAAQSVKVEVAFKLATDRAAGEQVIDPVTSSPLVVFFPTDKETRLGFLIQGPYRTTPARDNVPRDDASNRLLVEETAKLVVDVLPQLRDLGFMSVATLRALPIRAADFPVGSMFRPIYDGVRVALREQPLLPTYDGGFVAGKNAKVARGAELIQLLSPRQLTDLLGLNDPLSWLSAEITEAREPDLYAYLVGSGAEKPLAQEMEVRPAILAQALTTGFLKRQNDAWLARLYAYFGGRLSDVGATLSRKPFIRLEDDTYVAPFGESGRPNAYLPPSGETDYPIVRRAIAADKGAREFLQRMGLTEPDLITEVCDTILPKYGIDKTEVPAEENLEDLRKILRAVLLASGAKRQELAHKVQTVPFVPATHAKTGKRGLQMPIKVYVRSESLELYFAGNPAAWFLAVDDTWTVQVLESLGLSKTVRIKHRKPDPSGFVHLHDQHAWHKRGVNGFDPDCEIDGIAFALQHISPEKAAYIWNTLLIPHHYLVRGTVQESARQSFADRTERETPSRMGQLVSEMAWIPSPSGGFAAPPSLCMDDLPAEFQPDETLALALGVRPTPRMEEIASELGMSKEVLDFARRNPQQVDDLRRREEQRLAREKMAQAAGAQESGILAAALQNFVSRPGATQIVDGHVEPGPVPRPEWRRQQLDAEIARDIANEPSPGQRSRRVLRTVWEGKDPQVRAFLEEQYGGKCQICDDTFARRDGRPYFEGLYIVPNSKQGWTGRHGNVLCLCPTCCAKLLHASVVIDDVAILNQIEGFRAFNEGGGGSPALRIKVLGRPTRIRFTERHMMELQEMLRAERRRAVG